MSATRRWSTRLVIRQASELLLSRGARWRVLFPTDHLAYLIFETVLSASIAHLPMRRPGGDWLTVADAVALGRPISAAALSRSMSLAHTTVRRRVAALADAGLLVREATGFRVAPALGADGALARIVSDNATNLVRIMSDLADAGYRPAIRAIDVGVARLPADATERSLLIFVLRVLESLAGLYTDVTEGTIMAAITAANVRHVTDDPNLARRYAGEDAIPPDEERRPVTLRALARETGIPFETVRRRVDALVAAMMVRQADEGVIVPTAVLRGERQTGCNRRIIDHFEHMLEGLAALAIAGRAGHLH